MKKILMALTLIPFGIATASTIPEAKITFESGSTQYTQRVYLSETGAAKVKSIETVGYLTGLSVDTENGTTATTVTNVDTGLSVTITPINGSKNEYQVSHTYMGDPVLESEIIDGTTIVNIKGQPIDKGDTNLVLEKGTTTCSSSAFNADGKGINNKLCVTLM